MRIIAKRTLLQIAEAHGDCVGPVTDWYNRASKAEWHSLTDVRETYRTADIVGDKTVFSIKGNNYRLIVHINYETGIVYIKHLLTHGEYDKGKWKEVGR